ncbi:RNA polymerase factor sigma-54 [Arundinibacter roseus]|uniref:RNA polymerase sigma-54 factor n=1 Tax=Arundinibacter roseus TaxID=2070510 RepID=A0A4R4KAC9_9BACT|nr:RNA polymerase factor sigma-54 [Arundinibacter roseus]TDB63321.1 RNA polymerase sigma-54 factor [Arundinibacter roseus]
MQKLIINQGLLQKLSPQQIQFIKLLQIPTAELDTRIKEEMEVNPALEEGQEENTASEYDDERGDDGEFGEHSHEELELESYINHDELGGYKMYGDGAFGNEEDREFPVATRLTLHDSLYQQFGFMNLQEQERMLGLHLLGSIENDGYLRRPLKSIVSDLAFTQGVYTTETELKCVLKKIQSLEPAGIGASNLQECLLLQLRRKNQSDLIVQLALQVIEHYFEEFSKKHYEKIQKRLGMSQQEAFDVLTLITRLNPKPGSVEGDDDRSHYLTPDFILINNNGRLEVSLNSRNAPELRVNRSFAEMLDTYSKSDKTNKNVRETATFVKQKLDSAKWFIDAIKQRQATLMRTMTAILNYQYEFFREGDEGKLRPMILKDIATIIDMDVSTVSRVASSKCVQTEFGLYPLKYFFSEGIATDSGEDVSSREVKTILKELIDHEPKRKPFSDDKLEKLLNEKGYNIARRTVAKYREQLNIPVARLRKQI